MTTERELLTDVLRRVHDVKTADTAPVRSFVAGENLLFVELDCEDGSNVNSMVGVVHRPPITLPEKSLVRDVDGFELARWIVDPPDGMDGDPRGVKAVGVAALNALSAPHIDWLAGDPMAALSDDIDVIGTVGLFRPAFRKFGTVDVRVIEREPIPEIGIDPSPAVSDSVFEPADTEEALTGVEVLFVTGSSFIYGGVGRYLEAATDIPTVVLIGATASFLPEPAFDAGVTLLAGAHVTDVDCVVDGIRAGACATDLHDTGLEKVYVTDETTLPHVDLTRLK